VWGVENDPEHKITGTSFDPDKAPVGNQGLAIWLSRALNRQSVIGPVATMTCVNPVGCIE